MWPIPQFAYLFYAMTSPILPFVYLNSGLLADL